MHTVPPDTCKRHGCLVFTSHKTDTYHKWPEALHHQLTTNLHVRPLAEVESYVDFFNLTEADVAAVQGYLRYWMVLRQCCGSQMSLQFRLLLHGCTNVTIKDPDSLSYPACEVYRVNEVTRLFTRTSLYQAMHGHDRDPAEEASLLAAQCEADRLEIGQGKEFNGEVFVSCDAMLERWKHLS